MPAEHLNFFEPWPDLAGHHENQLTRAFLVVLRMSPVAHQAWLRLVDQELDLSHLPMPSIDTQTASITRIHHNLGGDQEEPIRGLSVLQAADVDEVSGPVGPSERAAIFDGIVRYGNELVLVVEVKFTPPSSDRQAREIPLAEARVQLDPRGRPVNWRDLLEAWQGLELAGHVSGAERLVISDFLRFVERNHSRLGPNRRLRLCGLHEGRILGRLRAVLEEAAASEAWVTPRHAWAEAAVEAETVRFVFLAIRDLDKPEPRVMVVLLLADTLQQARKLYRDRPHRVAAILSLHDAGWELWPNFHMGFRQRHVAGDYGACETDVYVAFWLEHIGEAHQMRRAEWESTLDEMATAGVVSSGYPQQIQQLEDYMDPLAPRPGIELSFSWPLQEAARLDDLNQFVGAVTAKVTEALTAAGER